MKYEIKVTLVMILGILLLSACNTMSLDDFTDNRDDAEATEDVVIEDVFRIAEETEEPLLTDNASNNNSNSVAGSNGGSVTTTNTTTYTMPTTIPQVQYRNPAPAVYVPACVPQHPEWVTYTVISGDTLAAIARRVNSTVSVLASVNCISNANLIYVGMVLRVPRYPINTPVPQPPPTIPVVGVDFIVDSVCAVVSRNYRATIWGDGGTPIAYLQGKIPLQHVADNAYIVYVHEVHQQGWISATEAILEGIPCNSTNPPPNQLPVVGTHGTPPNTNRCYLVRDNTLSYIPVYYGSSDAYAPIAVLADWAEIVNIASAGYTVRVPQYNHTVWIKPQGVRLYRTDCSYSNTIPVVGSPTLPNTVCAVVATNDRASIWKTDGSGTRLAYLEGRIQLESEADGAYVVYLPTLGMRGWISMTEAYLEGSTCPYENPPLSELPVVGYQGNPPADGRCYAVRDGSREYVPVYYGTADAYAPIATLNNYALVSWTENVGYSVRLPQYERDVWILTEGVQLQGDCNDADPEPQTCMQVYGGTGRPVVTPSTTISQECMAVQPGMVTVAWPQASSDFVELTFWRMNNNGQTDVIGVDTNPDDGASITWEVHASMPPSVIYVFAAGGTPVGDSGQLAVYVAP